MLVIDSQVAGIAGDMMVSALVDLGADGGRIINGITRAAEAGGAKLGRACFDKVERCGTAATFMTLEIGREDQGVRDMQSRISAACAAAGLSTRAASFSDSCVRRLLEAESRVHGVPIDSVRLHEAGSFDTIADIVGTAMALEDLELYGEEIISTPVAVGDGTVTFSHGTTSNPAGAILEILKGTDISISGCASGGECATPTGAAILAELASSCRPFYPAIKVNNTGYGAGAKNSEKYANVLKLVRGPAAENPSFERIAILETNIDDATGESLGHMIDKMMECGAKDVTVSPAITKKGRPAHLISIMCDTGLASKLAKTLMEETGTLGVRIRTSERMIASRAERSASITINGKKFNVRYKTGLGRRFKVESDDIIRISGILGESFAKTKELISGKIGDTI